MSTDAEAPSRADEQEAAELAALLMRNARDHGPLEAVRRLTRLLRILRIVTRAITAERDKRAYSLAAQWSQRDAAERIGVSASTMQRWMEAGRPNGNGARADVDNSESNGDE